MPVEELTPEQVEKLTAGVATAQQALDQSRVSMDESNKKVGELLTKQEKIEQGHDADRATLAEVKKQLSDQADKMQTIAEGYTNTTNTLRQQMKTLANDGGTEHTAYRYRSPGAKGAVFSCRQEALELGMFLMATMKAETDAKLYARRWLQDHKTDLRYLPNIPKSFVEQVANPILGTEDLNRMNQQSYGTTILPQALTGGATPGSVFVRPEFADTLIRNVELHGAFRRNALVWPMGSDTVYIPRRKSGVSWTWEGEADSATGTDPDFEQLGMTAKKGMMLHQFSSELGEDAAISLADIFMFEFALEIARIEDLTGFQGTGTAAYGGFNGVLGQTGTATVATAIASAIPHLVAGAGGANLISEVTYAKLRTMLGRLHTWAESGAKWYMHKTVLAELCGIETTAGNQLVTWDEKNAASMMGYPVERVDQMPSVAVGASTNAFCFGDLRKAWVLGDRRKPEVQTSEHYAFNTDQLTVRLTARIAFLMAQGNAMVIYATGSA